MFPILLILILLGLVAVSVAKAKHPRRHHHHSPRFLTAMRLNHGLRGSPMAHLGFELEAAGWRYRISPYFMAAVAGTESGLGVAACSNNRMNVWGLASCNQSWAVPVWRNWHDAIQFYARFLKQHWPRARTPWEFYGYAADSNAWGSKTALWMRSLFGVGPGVRYP